MIKVRELIESAEYTMTSFTYPDSSAYFTTVHGWQPELKFESDFSSLVPWVAILPPSGIADRGDSISKPTYQITFVVIAAWEGTSSADDNVKAKLNVFDALREHIEKNLKRDMVSAFCTEDTDGGAFGIKPVMEESQGEPLVFDDKNDEVNAQKYFAFVLVYEVFGLTKTPR